MAALTLQARLAALSEEQRAAVAHAEGTAVICSVPGSGKTLIVTLRIWDLIARRGVAPERICACAFTRESAREIQSRLLAFGLPKNTRVGTLHSIALEVMRSGTPARGSDANVDDHGKLEIVAKRAFDEEMRDHRRLRLRVGRFLRFIERAKANLLDPGDEGLYRLAEQLALGREATDVCVDAYGRYEAARMAAKLIAFDDMVFLAVRLLENDATARAAWQARYDHVLVDECQDLTMAQHRLAQLLAEKAISYIMIGDSSQSIYQFRGAAPAAFVDAADAADVVYRVRGNYRATPTLCAAATRLLVGHSWNLAGAVVPARDGPFPPTTLEATEHETSEEEAAAVVAAIRAERAAGTPWHQMTILYRVTSLLGPIEAALIHAQVPHAIAAGVGFYERAEVRDLTAYLRVAVLQDADESQVKRVVNKPFRYIGRTTIDAVVEAARRDRRAFLDMLSVHDPPHARTKRAIAEFVQLLVDLNKMVLAERPAVDLVTEILDRTGYTEWVSGATDDVDTSGRAAVPHEFLRIAGQFATAQALLAHVQRAAAEQSVARAGRNRAADAVVLSTVHGYKGREADVVFLIGASDALMPLPRNDADEELRIFYVALTRARRAFRVSWPRQVATADGLSRAGPSPFIARAGVELPAEAEGDVQGLLVTVDACPAG